MFASRSAFYAFFTNPKGPGRACPVLADPPGHRAVTLKRKGTGITWASGSWVILWKWIALPPLKCTIR
jgi:hypothetical protein